jgi:hypothetical protein
MSYTDQDLTDAVDAGVLSKQNADGFRHFIETRRQSSGTNEEYFRLLTGFNDIFVASICVLVLAASWMLISYFTPSADSSNISALATAALSWGLAEYFTRIRRMALPSIILLLSLVISAYVMADGFDFPAIQGLTAMLAAIGHWYRFRVPITIAAGVAAVVLIVHALMIKYGIDFGGVLYSSIIMAMGLATLGWAIWWDSRNTHRTTRQSDIAFWLHILSSFIIVHTLFNSVLPHNGLDDTTDTVSILITYTLLSLVSIILDRRALMVSALGYALFAVSTIFSTDSNETALSLACLIVGSGLLMLSAFWQQARHLIVTPLPDFIKKVLPPA